MAKMLSPELCIYWGLIHLFKRLKPVLTTDLKTPTWKLDSGLEPHQLTFKQVSPSTCTLGFIRPSIYLHQSLVCRERDSNSHEPKARRGLNPVCLPIPPSRLDFPNQPNKRWDGARCVSAINLCSFYSSMIPSRWLTTPPFYGMFKLYKRLVEIISQGLPF